MTSPVSARTHCQGGGGEAGEPLGTGVFGQFSLTGNCVAALHSATSNGIRSSTIKSNKEREREREKRRRNLINLSGERLERSRGRRRRENFSENHRKAERKSERQKTYLQLLAFG